MQLLLLANTRKSHGSFECDLKEGLYPKVLVKTRQRTFAAIEKDLSATHR